MKSVRVLCILALAGMGACSTYSPVVDGPRDARYDADLQDCQAIAAQGARQNSNVVGNAAAGAAVGGIIGSLSGNLGDGAAAGAGVGAVKGVIDQGSTRNAILRNCMRGRGHNVLN